MARAAALERGAAITDPLALRELDLGEHPARGLDRAGFGLRGFVAPAQSAGAPILNDELFALPSMAQMRRALDNEFDRYMGNHKARLANEAIGVGTAFDWQMFDRSLLYSSGTRFVLAGIVNRMDRAYVSPETCGEIRLIYRLTRLGEPSVGENALSPRLPMTLNLVLRAKGAKASAPGGIALTCKDIARRWLAMAQWPQTGAELATRLVSAGGPLEFIEPVDVKQIETNLQIAHAPKSPVRDFRTDYLLKVFRFNAQAQLFEEAPLENQIDRDRILADENLARDFKAWLLDIRHFNEFDRGTILIPERFLARGAIAATPAGFDRSELQPAFGLLQGEGTANPVFGESDVVAALKQAADNGVTPRNIRSVAGFQRRLNDVTCSGCHQTRGIGGFHFPGVDWMAAKPSNETVVPASPHFFGDQIRRRDILGSLSSGSRPDYSRGFSERPQLRARPELMRELAGTGYYNGWGARCYRQSPKQADNDPSFRSWTCANGLACQVAGKTSRMGMCFVKDR
ncbi:hypothetical protein [Bradyrhizobium sp.]|uniref:hypothetical protein n=1 Tax=Bradyrhizobium sp. TaxID=376 RepID=UPI003C7184ED